jgi:SAM-dependent methyltransferase
MVVEHLLEPATQFREIARVLRTGGRFVFHTPSLYGYPVVMARCVPDRIRGVAARILEGRAGEDRYPTLYRANSPRKIRRLAEEAGLAVARVDFVRSSAVFAMIPPLAAAELLWIRALGQERLKTLRPNLIVELVKVD